MILKFLPLAGVILLTACSSGKDNLMNERLSASIRYPSTQRLAYTLKHGANPNYKDSAGVPVLIKAVSRQKTDHVKMLLLAGADPNAADPEGDSALFAAAALKDTAMAKLLLESKADLHHRNKNGKTPLMEAARLGNLPAIKLFLEQGADPNQVDRRGANVAGYAAAAKENGIEALKLLEEKGTAFRLGQDDIHISPFLLALYFRNRETAVFLLNKMPDFNTDSQMEKVGQLAMRFAIENNLLELVKALVAKKLPLNLELPIGYQAAVLLNTQGVYKFAARNGVLDKNYSPLIYACIFARPEIVSFLIDSGANPHQETTEGEDAESYANDFATAEVLEQKTKEWDERNLQKHGRIKGLVIETDQSVKRTTLF